MEFEKFSFRTISSLDPPNRFSWFLSYYVKNGQSNVVVRKLNPDFDLRSQQRPLNFVFEKLTPNIYPKGTVKTGPLRGVNFEFEHQAAQKKDVSNFDLQSVKTLLCGSNEMGVKKHLLLSNASSQNL